LQDLENKKGFEESAIDKISGNKIKFFYLGPKNDWSKMLDKSLCTRIENIFQKEMIELGYI